MGHVGEWNGGGRRSSTGRRLKQSRSLSAFICYYFIVSSAKDGPRRVSPVLNHVRSVNRSVLSANRTRETTLRLISTTSNRIRLLLFYYAVKAILNHLWDAAERFLPCFLPTSSGNAFQKLKGIRVTSCLPIFGNSVTDHLFSFFSSSFSSSRPLVAVDADFQILAIPFKNQVYVILKQIYVIRFSHIHNYLIFYNGLILLTFSIEELRELKQILKLRIKNEKERRMENS